MSKLLGSKKDYIAMYEREDVIEIVLLIVQTVISALLAYHVQQQTGNNEYHLKDVSYDDSWLQVSQGRLQRCTQIWSMPVILIILIALSIANSFRLFMSIGLQVRRSYRTEQKQRQLHLQFMSVNYVLTLIQLLLNFGAVHFGDEHVGIISVFTIYLSIQLYSSKVVQSWSYSKQRIGISFLVISAGIFNALTRGWGFVLLLILISSFFCEWLVSDIHRISIRNTCPNNTGNIKQFRDSIAHLLDHRVTQNKHSPRKEKAKINQQFCYSSSLRSSSQLNYERENNHRSQIILGNVEGILFSRSYPDNIDSKQEGALAEDVLIHQSKYHEHLNLSHSCFSNGSKVSKNFNKYNSDCSIVAQSISPSHVKNIQYLTPAESAIIQTTTGEGFSGKASHIIHGNLQIDEQQKISNTYSQELKNLSTQTKVGGALTAGATKLENKQIKKQKLILPSPSNDIKAVRNQRKSPLNLKDLKLSSVSQLSSSKEKVETQEDQLNAGEVLKSEVSQETGARLDGFYRMFFEIISEGIVLVNLHNGSVRVNHTLKRMLHTQSDLECLDILFTLQNASIKPPAFFNPQAASNLSRSTKTGRNIGGGKTLLSSISSSVVNVNNIEYDQSQVAFTIQKIQTLVGNDEYPEGSAAPPKIASKASQISSNTKQRTHSQRYTQVMASIPTVQQQEKEETDERFIMSYQHIPSLRNQKRRNSASTFKRENTLLSKRTSRFQFRPEEGDVASSNFVTNGVDLTSQGFILQRHREPVPSLSGFQQFENAFQLNSNTHRSNLANTESAKNSSNAIQSSLKGVTTSIEQNICLQDIIQKANFRNIRRQSEIQDQGGSSVGDKQQIKNSQDVGQSFQSGGYRTVRSQADSRQNSRRFSASARSSNEKEAANKSSEPPAAVVYSHAKNFTVKDEFMRIQEDMEEYTSKSNFEMFGHHIKMLCKLQPKLQVHPPSKMLKPTGPSQVSPQYSYDASEKKGKTSKFQPSGLGQNPNGEGIKPERPAEKKKIIDITFIPCSVYSEKCLVLVVKDVSHFNSIQVLKDLNENRSKMLNYVVHEIRSPLNSISNYLRCSLDSVSRSIKESFIDPALQSAQMLNFLVSDLLDIAQVKAGKYKLNIRPFKVEELIQDVMNTMNVNVKHKSPDIDFFTYIDPAIIEPLASDQLRIKQILINLVSKCFENSDLHDDFFNQSSGNATKFTEKGSIKVEVSQVEQRVLRFSVSDTGIGISEEQKKKLFREFSKIENEETDILNPQGVGLGLVISNTLAKSLAPSSYPGGLQVGSSSLQQKGTTFYFHILNFNKTITEPKKLKTTATALPSDMMKSNDFRDSDSIVCGVKRVQQEDELEGSNKSFLVKAWKSQELSDNLLGSVEIFPVTQQQQSLLDVQNLFNASSMINSDEAQVGKMNYFRVSSTPRFDNAENEKRKSDKCAKIMIVDDQVFQCLSLMHLIEKFSGLKCDKCHSGASCLQKVTEKKDSCCPVYSLMFVDLNILTENDGFKVLKELQDLYSLHSLAQPNFVAYSGMADTQTRQACLDAGFIELLEKPVNFDRLSFILHAFA